MTMSCQPFINYWFCFLGLSGQAIIIHFILIITISLGVFNLLPIPILDGGHIAFLIIEKIKGKPVGERTFVVAQYVGLAFLLGLVVFVTKNDFANFIF